MSYKILVTMATGEKSKASAIYALKLAKAVRGEVTALYVSDSTNYINNLACNVPLGKGEEALRWILEKGVELDVPVHTIIAEGIPAEEIIKKSSNFDALVMGTAGKAGASHFLLGSVTEKVIRYSDCPVIAIRNHDPDKPFRLEKMLIATDGSKYTARAVVEGLEMAKRTPGMTKITALSVLDSRTISRVSRHLHINVACELAAKHVEEEGHKFGLEVETVIVPGRTAEVIGRMSADYDMVAMGTMGRTGLKRLREASVAEKTVREINCPVMIVRARKDIEPQE